MFQLIRSGRAAFVVLAAVVALAGCTMNPIISPEVKTQRIAKIDRFVGVYLSEDTRTTVWTENKFGDTYKFPIGGASARAIEDAARRTFQRTAKVKGLPPLGPGGADVDAVLEAEIEGFSFVLPLLKTSTYRAEITYRFTLHTTAGLPAASWVVVGEGAQRGQLGFEFARWPGEAATLAIEDAMRQLIEDTDQNSEVIKWLRDTAPDQPEIKAGA